MFVCCETSLHLPNARLSAEWHLPSTVRVPPLNTVCLGLTCIGIAHNGVPDSIYFNCLRFFISYLPKYAKTNLWIGFCMPSTSIVCFKPPQMHK